MHFTPDEIAMAVHAPMPSAIILDLTTAGHGQRRDLTVKLANELADMLTVSDDREGPFSWFEYLTEVFEHELDGDGGSNGELACEPIDYPDGYEGATSEERVTLHVAALLAQTDVYARDEWAAERLRLVG